MKIILIVAVGSSGIIGVNGQLPWHLPEDLKRFKELTLGHSVIMGRKTWDSLPEKVRPLPQRKNIVLTHDPTLKCPGAVVVSNLENILRWVGQAPENETAYVIGGESVYREFFPLASRLEVTWVNDPVKVSPSDQVSYFPLTPHQLYNQDWVSVSEVETQHCSFETFERMVSS